MIIRGDLLRINTSPVDAVGGAKPTTEERPAERVQLGAIPSQMTDGSPAAGGFLSMGATRVESTVGEFARGIRRTCGSCRFFDRDSWLQMRAALEAADDILVRDELNGLRAHFLTTPALGLLDFHEGADGEMDAEHAIGAMGLCRAYTEYLKCPPGEEVIVHPMGVCPEKLGDLWPESPDAELVLPILHKPRDKDAARNTNAAYDGFMRAAESGKK